MLSKGLVNNQHWFRYWLDAWWHQDIAITNIDLPSTISCVIDSKILFTFMKLNTEDVNSQITSTFEIYMPENFPNSFRWGHYICYYIDGLVQDYCIFIANALEILQSCIKPSIYNKQYLYYN